MQVSLGGRAVGWYEDAVERWIGTRQTTKGEQEAGVRVDGITVLTPKFSPRPDRLNKNPIISAAAPAGRKGRDTGRTPAPSIKRAPDAQAAVSSSEELRHLRDENARLKRLIADLVLKNDLLQSAIQGNVAAS